VDFPKRVGLVCRAIPPGRVATYGQIALLCGRPQCPRQVGTVLSRGTGGEVPAHRVVNRQGYLSGARCFLEPGIQRLSLEAEGVPVSPGQTVDLKKYGWRPGEKEQEALWAAFQEQGI
jgi:methylated-DNA-protein-cysteine methyltransferase-like protein